MGKTLVLQLESMQEVKQKQSFEISIIYPELQQGIRSKYAEICAVHISPSHPEGCAQPLGRNRRDSSRVNQATRGGGGSQADVLGPPGGPAEGRRKSRFFFNVCIKIKKEAWCGLQGSPKGRALRSGESLIVRQVRFWAVWEAWGPAKWMDLKVGGALGFLFLVPLPQTPIKKGGHKHPKKKPLHTCAQPAQRSNAP